MKHGIADKNAVEIDLLHLYFQVLCKLWVKQKLYLIWKTFISDLSNQFFSRPQNYIRLQIESRPLV